MSNDTSYVMPFSHPDDLSDCVVIDLETTGIDPQTCKIIQLAAVRYIGHQEPVLGGNIRCPHHDRRALLLGFSERQGSDIPRTSGQRRRHEDVHLF